MTDLITLHNRIAALALKPTVSRARNRELMNDLLNDPVEALIIQIEETRLPRLLIFQNDRMERLTLQVVAGRILAVKQPISEGLAKLCPNVLGQDLGASDHAQKVEFAGLLKVFLENVTRLSVRTEFPQAASDTSMVGLVLNCEFLESHTAVRKREQLPRTVDFELFGQKLVELSTAVVRIDGDEITIREGEPEYRDRLLRLAEEELPTHSKPNSDPAHFVLLNAEASVAQAVICAAASGSVLFATFPSGHLNDVLALWADCRN